MYTCFMFVDVLVIEIREVNKNGKIVKFHVTSITPVLQDLAVFFHYYIILHFDVGRCQIQWNLKVKGEISVCTAIMLNDRRIPI